MIINKQIGGSGGEAASIFITGLSETDTVTCTKDGKTKQGKWVEREVTVYNKNLVPAMTSNTEPKGVASASSEYVDSNGNNKSWKAFDRTHTDGWDQWSSPYGASLPQWIQYKFDSPVTINGMKLCNLADASYATNSVGYVSISDDGENFTKIHEFSVPITTIDSPAEVQFSKSYTTQYVRVYLTSYNNTYSSGTCRIALLQFMGYETSVKQGWLFDKLKEYGTYTITATNDTDTVTQDVLVDMATEFDIEMSYIKDKLLTSDDFQNGIFKNGTHSILTNQENDTDGIRLVGTASRVYNNPSLDAFIRLDMTIDFTGYSKLKFKMKKVVNHGIMLVVVTDGLKNTSKSWDDALGYTPSSSYTEPLTVAYVGVTKSYKELTANVWNDYEIDVSNVTGEHVLTFVGGYTDSTGYSTSETHYCDIWLMK